MYNLGPNGLSNITTTSEYFTTYLFKMITVEGTSALAVYLEVKNIMKRDTTTYYQFFPKQTKTGSTIVYWYGGTSSNTPPEQKGLYYVSNQTQLNLPIGEHIPDGWYAARNDGQHPMGVVMAKPEGPTTDYVIYYERLLHFTSGKQDKVGKISWRESIKNGSVSNPELDLGE